MPLPSQPPRAFPRTAFAAWSRLKGPFGSQELVADDLSHESCCAIIARWGATGDGGRRRVVAQAETVGAEDGGALRSAQHPAPHLLAVQVGGDRLDDRPGIVGGLQQARNELGLVGLNRRGRRL